MPETRPASSGCPNHAYVCPRTCKWKRPKPMPASIAWRDSTDPLTAWKGHSHDITSMVASGAISVLGDRERFLRAVNGMSKAMTDLAAAQRSTDFY